MRGLFRLTGNFDGEGAVGFEAHDDRFKRPFSARYVGEILAFLSFRRILEVVHYSAYFAAWCLITHCSVSTFKMMVST
jgi:hypothetical protein